MNIDVDFEVYKALTNLRESETDGYNDVLKRLLKISPKAEKAAPERRMWHYKGASLPVGTELRARNRGQVHSALLGTNSIKLNGENFDSPSRAAMSITASSINGWAFWQFQDADGQWKPLDSARAVKPRRLDAHGFI